MATSPHGVGGYRLHQIGPFESDGIYLGVVAIGEDDQSGGGAHDEGVHENAEGLDHSLLDGVLYVSGGGDVSDGTETGLVGEHTPLESGDDYGSHGSSKGTGHSEGVAEDHGDRVDYAVYVEAYGNDGEDDPQDGHDGNDLGGELGDGLESLEQDHCRKARDDQGEDEVVVIELERAAEGVGGVTGLDSDESDSESKNEEYCGDDPDPSASETFQSVICRTAVEVAVLLLLLVYLSESGLHEAAGGPYDGEYPHPEDRTGTSHDDGGSDSRYISDAYTGAHSDAKRFERGDLGGLLTFGHPGKRQ